MSDPTPDSPPSALQFERAEYAGDRPKCAACQSVLERTYYHLGGRRICLACAEVVRANQLAPAGPRFRRGLLYGAGMAAACSIGYAIITYVTHMEAALISILVGYLIGRAIRKGTGGLGGRKLQIAAVMLTYCSITIAYVPLIVKDVVGQAKKTEGLASRPKPNPPVTLGSTVVAVAVIGGLALALPFFMIASGVSGILGLVIVFFGLWRAWRETAGDGRLLMGPYTVSGESVSG